MPELIDVTTWLIAEPSAVITGANPLNELMMELTAAPTAKITGDIIANDEAIVGSTGATITRA